MDRNATAFGDIPQNTPHVDADYNKCAKCAKIFQDPRLQKTSTAALQHAFTLSAKTPTVLEGFQPYAQRQPSRRGSFDWETRLCHLPMVQNHQYPNKFASRQCQSPTLLLVEPYGGF